MDRTQKALLWGTMLGDGHMQRTTKGAWLRLGHADWQAGYLEYKIDVLSPALGTPRRNSYVHKTGAICLSARWPSHTELAEVYDAIYRPKKQIGAVMVRKVLDCGGLPYWIGDDGTVEKDKRIGFNASDRVRLFVSSKKMQERDAEEVTKMLDVLYGGVGLLRKQYKIGTMLWEFSFDSEASQRVGAEINPILGSILPHKTVAPRTAMRRYVHLGGVESQNFQK